MVQFEEIIGLLGGGEATRERARKVKLDTVGNAVYLRGLIELSNICRKDCFYCGIRNSNKKVIRYDIEDEDVVQAARYAWENGYGSIAIQSGERNKTAFTDRIERLLYDIKEMSRGELGITLSLGEQSYDTLRRWREAGADRYLLRIETSNRRLYNTIHPNDQNHSYDRRIEVLHDLRSLRYQLGTGVMIGLPGQNTEHLAEDILFFQEIDIDMCGMGPYIEHNDTPLAIKKSTKKTRLPGLEERFEMTLQMIATLRCVMPDVNIAATTAMQAIHPQGREMALDVGANVLMPNITPSLAVGDYKLYNSKPVRASSYEELFASLRRCGFEVALGNQGNSKRYASRK